jgi:hypothetical protein
LYFSLLMMVMMRDASALEKPVLHVATDTAHQTVANTGHAS